MDDHCYSVISGSITANEYSPEYMQQFDNIIEDFMKEQGIPGAAFVLNKDGHPVYKQGYGISGPGQRVKSTSMFRIASISKVITAFIILKLCEEGKLDLNAKVFGPKEILSQFHLTSKSDRRIKKISVRHLLQHSAGWDRDKSGDPVFWRIKENKFNTYNENLIQFLLQRKLNFSPGTKHAYSNFGYLILGSIIEAVTQRKYEDCVKDLMRKIDIDDIYEGKTRKHECGVDEVMYYNNREPLLLPSVFKEEGMVVPQYGSFPMEDTGSYGGLVTNAGTLVHFLDNIHTLIQQQSFDLMTSRPAYCAANEWYGLGLDVQDGGLTYGHTGNMEGTSSTLLHHKSGITWSLLFNAWSVDNDIDGLVKYALCTTTFSYNFGLEINAKDISVGNCYKHVRAMHPALPSQTCSSCRIMRESISSQDKSQAVWLMYPYWDESTGSHIHSYLEEMKSNGYKIIALNAIVLKKELFFNIIWEKSQSNWICILDVGASNFDNYVSTYKHKQYDLVYIESYRINDEIYFAIVFEQRINHTEQIWYCNYEPQSHLDCVEKYRMDGFHLDIQSVLVDKNNDSFTVTAVYSRDRDGKSVSWLQITDDEYVFELDKLGRKEMNLTYVKVFNVNNSSYFSCVWSSKQHGTCLQRHHASKYGFLYEVSQSLNSNIRLKHVCAYINEGILNFAAVWYN